MGPPVNQPRTSFQTSQTQQQVNEEAPIQNINDSENYDNTDGPGHRIHPRSRPNNVTVNVNNSSRQVIDSTPQLITQFVVNRMENDNLNIPVELQNRCRANNVNKDIANCLQRIGDDLSNNHQLNHLISSIRVTPETAYKTFLSVASNVFADGTINWGRVVSLFYFAYKLALQVVNQLPLVDLVIGWVVRYVTEKLAWWIAARGGWGAVQEYFGSTTLQFVSVFAAGILVAYIFNKFVR